MICFVCRSECITQPCSGCDARHNEYMRKLFLGALNQRKADVLKMKNNYFYQQLDDLGQPICGILPTYGARNPEATPDSQGGSRDSVEAGKPPLEA